MERFLWILCIIGTMLWCEPNDGFSITSADIPDCHTHIFVDTDGRLFIKDPAGDRFDLVSEVPKYTLAMLRGNPQGSEEGIHFHFWDQTHKVGLEKGKVYYGFIDPDEGPYCLPVFYKEPAKISDYRADIDIAGTFTGRYQTVEWEKTGHGVLGYRVVSEKGRLLYDGKIAFTGSGPFQVDTCIIEGPFVNQVSPHGARISFETNRIARGKVQIDGKVFFNAGGRTRHEISIDGLSPGKVYPYRVSTEEGMHRERRELKTAPLPGTRSSFVFAYASDSRAGQGGGERDIWGVNAYMMKRIMALVASRDAAFLQFTGDLIYGYENNLPEQRLQYSNWKRAVEPWAGHTPVVAAMGNHESLTYLWDDGSDDGMVCDRFPYDTDSSEAVFADTFVNPGNGPESEDGSLHDPNPDKTDFPSYQENVFYYTFDNVAVIALNSDYWYSFVLPEKTYLGGNPHGYIMDNQLTWLEATLKRLQADDAIDFVFVTHHAPVFPNAGHVEDAMWYSGTNDPRPVIKGQPVAKGIIERRDEYWAILMRHPKVVAVLTGDDHNFSKMLIREGMDLYDADRYAPAFPLEISRPIWQINNGAGGAPYHSREPTPWYENVESFSTQNAVVFFHVHGKRMTIEVVNPGTLAPVN